MKLSVQPVKINDTWRNCVLHFLAEFDNVAWLDSDGCRKIAITRTPPHFRYLLMFTHSRTTEKFQQSESYSVATLPLLQRLNRMIEINQTDTRYRKFQLYKTGIINTKTRLFLQYSYIYRVRQASFLFSYCNKKNSSKDIFSIFFITKGTHLKLWLTSF
jgi:hypothetical protein